MSVVTKLTWFSRAAGRGRLLTAALIVVATATPVRPAGFEFTAGEHAMLPESDPNGLLLALAVEAAANHYGKIIRDPWFIALEYRYADPRNFNVLAKATPLSQIEFDRAGQPGKLRTQAAIIEFSPTANWFYDPSPMEHSEFDLAPTYVADLSSSQRSTAFNGNPPARLEVSLQGPMRSASSTGYDLLTVALHELGHVLGITQAGVELDDADFDVNPAFLHGQAAAVRSVSAGNAHLRVEDSLLDTALGPRRRYLPSATDIFAMAATAGWQQIDLPRKEFWGGESWHEPINWAGNRLPDLEDDVFVRSGSVVSLNGQAQAGRLFVDEAATLVVGTHRLQVRELHLGQGARLVHHGGGVTADRLFMDSSAGLSGILGAEESRLGLFFDGAQLAGTLELRAADYHAPAAGDVHPLLFTPSLEGNFDRVVLTGESTWEGIDVRLATETIGDAFTQLAAQFVVAGDTNADGRVDQADLDAVLVGWGRHVAAAWVTSGDLDGNGLVDQGDLDRVLVNWGRSIGSIRSPATPIPEPATAALALVAFAALLVRKLRK